MLELRVLRLNLFWHPSSGFLLGQKKIILTKRRGKSMKQKLLEIVQVTVLFQTDEIIFVWSFKNGNGRQNHPLLGCQNWDTSTGGCQNLVPG